MEAAPDREGPVMRAQGAYYALTGIWPLLDMRSFQRLTGPKLEHWLVKTVGLCVGVTGTSLWMAAERGSRNPETALLGAGTAAALCGVDLVYVARRRISPVYLVDAALQAALVAGWVRAAASR
jgi:hypothetical protein